MEFSNEIAYDKYTYEEVWSGPDRRTLIIFPVNPFEQPEELKQSQSVAVSLCFGVQLGFRQTQALIIIYTMTSLHDIDYNH